MNVSFLLKQYFDNLSDVSIDVFDSHTLNDIYQNVFKTLTSYFEIEVSVLQALSYCFYEILDNVHIHSGRPIGTAMTHFDAQKEVLRVLVADDGMGIRESLAKNDKFCGITEKEALFRCIEDSVTDGKGMGFGLYATSRLMKDVGLRFVIHSGCHKLISEHGETNVVKNGLWKGTIVYLEITTSREIDPNDVVEHRTDADVQYNECFVETDELGSLWRDFPAERTFTFSKYGTDFGTREMGAMIRKELKSIIDKGVSVALDFSGVNVVSNSFSDECIAKLLLEMPLDSLKRIISFRNLTPMAERSILIALQRRYKLL